MAVKIGFVTIGQSPRTDVVPEIARILGPEVRILEKGALDGLSGEEIRKLRPEKGDFRLITKLRDGRAAVVGRRRVVPILRKKIAELAAQNVYLIGLLCTDELPRIEQPSRHQGILLRPSRLLSLRVAALLEKGKLGVFVPLEEQISGTKRKWKETGLRIIVEALNPYQDYPGQSGAIERMKDQAVDLAVLDCIGYTQKMKDQIQRCLGKPVLLPRAVLASAIRELL